MLDFLNEQTAFIIAQVISTVTALIAILSLQLKNMKAILACQIVSNLLAGTTYILLGGLAGAGISLIAVAQAIVMFILKQKNIEHNIFVTLAFIAAFVGYSVWSFSNFFDLLPMSAAIFYALSVSQKNPRLYRIFGTANPIFWLVYDIHSLALVNFLMHAGIFISGVVGIVRLDIIGRRKGGDLPEIADEK